MFHTAAFFEDTGAAHVNDQIDALQDGFLTIRNNNFFLVQDAELLYAAVYGGDLTAARLDSPTLRDITRPQLAPLGNAVIPPADGPRVVDYHDNPLRIFSEEEVSLEVSDPTAIANNITGVIGLRFRNVPAPRGSVYTLLATSTTAAVASAWTNIGPLTFENTLRSGKYAVVGMQAFSANMISARLLFTNVDGQLERPGCIGGAAQDVLTHAIFRQGRLGLWGTFDNVILPEVEVLCDAADVAFRILIDIVKVS